MNNRIAIKDIESEIKINTSRSSGAGGQHVNKVETKAEVRFNVAESRILSEKEKATIMDKMASKLTKNQELIVTSDKSRSQHKNKDLAIKKLYRYLSKSLEKKKKRKKTKPTRASQMKRLDSKKKHGEKKRLRKNVY